MNNKFFYKITKNLILILGFIFIFCFNNIYAHVLKTDGSIGAILHIDPDDDPVAGTDSKIYFEFKDKNNKLNPQNCNCTISVLENNQILYSNLLFGNTKSDSLNTPPFTFKFPQKDVYILLVKGKSTDNSFEDFTLSYDVRVAKESNTTMAATNTNSTIILYIGLGVLGLLIGAFIFASFRNHKKI